MKKKLFLFIYAILGTASYLGALGTETSEDRQKDTFTLYDRNRRELNWQRQQRDRQVQAKDSRGDRAYRGMSRGDMNSTSRGGYTRAPFESESATFRGYSQPSYQPPYQRYSQPSYYDRGYSQTSYSGHQQFNHPYPAYRSQDAFPIPASPPVD